MCNVVIQHTLYAFGLRGVISFNLKIMMTIGPVLPYDMSVQLYGSTVDCGTVRVLLYTFLHEAHV